MKKIYSAPQQSVGTFTMRYNLMMETAQEVLSKKRDESEQEEIELEEEEEFVSAVISAVEDKPLW